MQNTEAELSLSGMRRYRVVQSSCLCALGIYLNVNQHTTTTFSCDLMFVVSDALVLPTTDHEFHTKRTLLCGKVHQVKWEKRRIRSCL